MRDHHRYWFKLRVGGKSQLVSSAGHMPPSVPVDKYSSQLQAAVGILGSAVCV